MNNQTNCNAVQDEVNINELLAKYDRESDYRRFGGWGKWVVALIAISFSVFQIWTAMFGVLDAHIQRAVHLSFAMALVFLLYPSRKSWSRENLHWLDGLLAIVAAAAPLYIVVFYNDLVLRAGMATLPDMILGGLGVLLVLEAARRVVGWPIISLAP
ncbi:hypothetical protein ACU70A_06155 [Syntrophomonas erecta subsp. sporosyntropha]